MAIWGLFLYCSSGPFDQRPKMVHHPTMDPNEMIGDMCFDEANSYLFRVARKAPKSAIDWILEHWDRLDSVYLRMIPQLLAGRDDVILPPIASAFSYVIHFWAEKREKAAYPIICKLLHDADGTNDVLQDDVVDTLPAILINVFDGDPAPLQSVIEDPNADELARAQALAALAFVVADGQLKKGWMHSYLLTLRSSMQPRGASFIWEAWATTVAVLGFEDLRSEVVDLIKLGYLEETGLDLEEFDELVAVGIEDPLEALEEEDIRPYSTVFRELGYRGIKGFSNETDEEEVDSYDDELCDAPVPQEPAINVNREIGRNDPCPCGSGKKYKKCCLKA